MPSRRRLILTSMFAIMGIILAIVVMVWLTRPAELSMERLQAVKVGMTQNEVQETVGLSPGVYPKGVPFFSYVGFRQGQEYWHCANTGNQLNVWYDEHGHVNDVVLYQNGSIPNRYIVWLRSRQP